MHSNRIGFIALLAAGASVVIGLEGCASHSAQDGPQLAPSIVTASVVPYAEGVGTPEMRAECDWNKLLPGALVKESRGRVAIDDAAAARNDGRRLQLEIIAVHAIGGGRFSGPKWALIRATLLDGNSTVGTFENHRTTIGGRFTACGTLQDLGGELAEDVAEWLKDDPTKPRKPD